MVKLVDDNITSTFRLDLKSIKNKKVTNAYFLSKNHLVLRFDSTRLHINSLPDCCDHHEIVQCDLNDLIGCKFLSFRTEVSKYSVPKSYIRQFNNEYGYMPDRSFKAHDLIFYFDKNGKQVGSNKTREHFFMKSVDVGLCDYFGCTTGHITCCINESDECNPYE